MRHLALTGLLADTGNHWPAALQWEHLVRHCYRWADAMLSERERTNGRPTFNGIPVSYEKSHEKRCFFDTNHDAGPVAWAVVYPNGVEAMIAWRKTDAEDMASASDRIVPLYRQPALTDEEREAIGEAIRLGDQWGWSETLRGLLERLA